VFIFPVHAKTDDTRRRTHVSAHREGFPQRRGREQRAIRGGKLTAHFTNGDGLHNDATDRLAYLTEETTFPLCMQFRDANVDWLRIDADDLPGDLRINVNPEPIPTGEILPAIHAESLSGGYTHRLDFTAHLADHTFEQLHKAYVRFLSPYGSIDAYVGSGATQIRRDDPATDGFQFILGKEPKYHIQFKDLQFLNGWAKHGCGKQTFYDVEYTRQLGAPSRVMSDLLDLGDDCDKNRLRFNNLPRHVRWEVKWPKVTESTFNILESSDPITSIDWWAKVHCLTDDFCVKVNEPVFWSLGVANLPAGAYTSEVLLNLASGKIRMLSDSGRVGRVDFGFSWGADPNYYVNVGATNVALKVEWDADGDTRFDGVPAYAFIDTLGQPVPLTLRTRMGSAGVGWGKVVRAWDFQFKVFEGSPWTLYIPTFKAAGFICGGPTAEILIAGRWWSVPTSLLSAACQGVP
jgi:hypothetical protein